MDRIKSGVVFVVSFIFCILLVSAVNLIVITPVTNSVFNNKNISYNLTSNEISDFYILKNRLSSNSADKLCDDVTSCNVSVSAREGNNNVTIKIINMNGDVNSTNINFLVDTISPRHIISFPKDGKMISNNELFRIKYTEENLKNIILYYGNMSLINSSVIQNCSSGEKQNCNFNVNLTSFDGQRIKYWFVIFDKAGNFANSSVKLVDVDTDNPKVLSKSYSIQKNKVSFNFQIEEENFDKIVLIDNSGRNPEWVRLCSRLSLGSCVKSKNFKSGIHSINVKVYDNAGNYANIYTNEIIVIN